MDFFRRFLFRLLHDERVLNRMSESRPIRLFAKLGASLFMQAKSISQDPAFKKLHPEKIKEVASGFSKEFVQTFKDAKEEIKKGIKK